MLSYFHSISRTDCCMAIADEQILKDGMQHVGKLICSNLGARMDSEPKRWRILGFPSFLYVFYAYYLCSSFARNYGLNLIRKNLPSCS